MKTHLTFSRLLACAMLMLLSSQVFAQGREFIRNTMREKGECRNVAITKYNGDLMLWGTNGWASTRCPESLTDALSELHDDNEYIDDVQLTDQGRWLILYGNNGIRWNDIPYSLESKLRELNDKSEVILSVTFNDARNWIVVTKNYYATSDQELTDWLKEGFGDHNRMLWTACITDDGLVAVYDGGYRFAGNVPNDLRDALRNTKLDVYRLKIAGTAWFFADLHGHYRYNM